MSKKNFEKKKNDNFQSKVVNFYNLKFLSPKKAFHF